MVAYYLGPDGTLQHDSLCFSSDDISHYTSFLYQVQTMLAYYLKANHPHIIKNQFTSLAVVEASTETTRTLWICVLISVILVLMLNGCFLQQAIANLPVMALVEQLKPHVAKQSLQRSLNNQILDYKAILDFCENEMTRIKFFGICKEGMISVEDHETEK